MDRTSEIEGHQLYESSVIQLPKLVTLNVMNFGTITLADDRDGAGRAQVAGDRDRHPDAGMALQQVAEQAGGEHGVADPGRGDEQQAHGRRL